MKKITWGGGYSVLNKRAFTLVELLAVIIILGIISAIAIPKVLNTVNKTKKQALLISADNYVRAVDQQLLVEETNKVVEDGTYEVGNNGEICIGTNCIKIEFEGNSPEMGTLIIEDSKVKKALNLQYIQNKDIIYISKLNGEESKIEEYIPVVEIVEGMTPVKYDGSNWKVVSIADNWYDYAKQEWANAVILETGVTKNIGDTVDVSSEVKGMFVYIPRYGYKIDGTYGKGGTSQTSPGEIEIKFFQSKTTLQSFDYKIHPAFTFGSEELSGVWVGKFETSTSKSSTCYTSGYSANCNNENQEPYIIPNVRALGYQNISNQFITAQKFNNYITSGDSHMMKNSEWGAVAYLSQSKYGKYGNTLYSGVNKEIYQNKSEFITGKSNGTTPTKTAGTQCTYDDIMDRGNGTGSCGGGASTTGNITGIYDMSGGSFENVMGYLSGVNDKWGAAADKDYAEFSNIPQSKYFDSYISENISSNSIELSKKSCKGGICYGHALSETSNWYSDSINFILLSNPWVVRGGYFGWGSEAGIFSMHAGNGTSLYTNSFRISIVKI